MDYKGNPLDLCLTYGNAEYITKVHAICAKSGNLANHSHRISKNKSLIHWVKRKVTYLFQGLNFKNKKIK